MEKLFSFVIAATVSLLLLAGAARGQDSLNVTRLSQFYNWSDAYELKVAGNYAFVAAGDKGLVIIDISNSETPFTKALLNGFGSAQGIFLEGDYAYIAAGNGGLQIINISDPAHPILSGHTNTPGNALKIFVAGNYAYVADENSGLQIIDISNPLAPFIAFSYPVPDGIVRDVYVQENYAYIGAGQAGFLILDVSNPLQPLLVSQSTWLSSISSVFVHDSIAYLASSPIGWKIFNVTNPSTPVEIASLAVNDGVYSITVSGTRAYLTTAYSSPHGPDPYLEIWDVSTPESPFRIGSLGVPNHYFAYDVAISSNFAYLIGSELGLIAIDVGNPASPAQVGSVDPLGGLGQMNYSGNYLYLAESNDGLRVYDLAILTQPVQIGRYYWGLWGAAGLALEGNLAYLGIGSTFRILDVSNPEQPLLIDYCNTPSMPLKIIIRDSIAYLTCGFDGLRVIDIHNSDPHEIGYHDTQGFARGLAISGNYAYIAQDWPGVIEVLDISIPFNPSEVAALNIPDVVFDVEYHDNFLYVATQDSGLRIIDVHNPATPFEAASFVQSYGAINTIEVSGIHLFLGCTNSLRILDLSSPTAPVVTGYYNGTGSVSCIVISENLAFLGLNIYDCSAAHAVNPWEAPQTPPASFALHPCFPNPFNPSTAISYELRAASQVNLRIYDTAGRLVSTLVNERQPAGTHDATFDGSHLASGIYLAKLEAGEFTAVQKLVLMK